MTNIQKDHFEEHYRNFDPGTRKNLLNLQTYSLLDLHVLSPDTMVLDIGAGAGIFLDGITSPCKKYAVDISEEAVRKLTDKGINAACLDLDANPLPYSSNTFDYIFCMEVIEHLTRPAEALREIYRTLKPSGRFIVSVPNIYQLLTPLLYLADIPPVNSARYGHVHVNDFTVRVLKKALRENGFTVLRVAGDEIFPLKDPISRWIARKIPRLAHHLIAICEKTS